MKTKQCETCFNRCFDVDPYPHCYCKKGHWSCYPEELQQTTDMIYDCEDEEVR